jgi:PHD/YefM family antitoxin component YafN of YafNO toxin-antitoxin module
MTTLSATEARKSLYSLLDDVAISHDPIQIVGKRHSAVLVSEEDWRAIQETLYLTSIPGMRESIQDGLNSPIEECGELATGIYQTCPKGCKKDRTFRTKATS